MALQDFPFPSSRCVFTASFQNPSPKSERIDPKICLPPSIFTKYPYLNMYICKNLDYFSYIKVNNFSIITPGKSCIIESSFEEGR